MNAEQLSQKINEILTKTWADKQFKHKLLTDTAATLKAEGVEVPAGYTVNVCENTNTVLNFVLPPNPNGELTDLELEAVAGGKGSPLNIFTGALQVGAGLLLRNPGIIGGGINRANGSDIVRGM